MDNGNGLGSNGESKIGKVRAVLTWVLLVLGTVLVLLALAAERLGVGLTPGFGIVQMAQLLVGLTCLTLGGFMMIRALRPDQAMGEGSRSLQADIGVRLAATGLVFAYITGMADLIGIGTHVTPRFERPFVGPFQLGGILLGVLIILVGLLLYYTSRGAGRRKSSMEFLVNGEGEK
jgi:uncharacterized membrane protein